VQSGDLCISWRRSTNRSGNDHHIVSLYRLNDVRSDDYYWGVLMNTRTIRRVAVTFGVSAIAIASAAAAFAATTGVSATRTDTVVTASTAHGLSPSGGVFTDVLTLNLPSGKYVIQANGNLVDWSASDYTRCHITVGSRQIASVNTVVGAGSVDGKDGPAAILSPFSLTGAIAIKAPRTATLQCEHDIDVTDPAYIDPGASMWAHKTDSLNVTAE
jgi:hypothetical protein